MKKTVTASAILLCLALPQTASAEWPSPWKTVPAANITSLMTDGYRIISTNVVYMGPSNGLLEIIYLQKGTETYKCTTTKLGAARESEHVCEVSVLPEQND